MSKKITVMVLTIMFLLHALSSYSQNNLNQKTNLLLSVQEDPENQLGLIFWVKKLEEATRFLKEEKDQDAEKILTNAKSYLTDATEYHYNLFQVLSKQPKTSSQSKIEKAHALDFGGLRDQSYYLLAQVYIRQNKLKEAVKLLIEVVKSQGDSELGHKAYKALQDIKFSD